MKLILLLIALLSLSCKVLSLDCGTPVECYTKAIEALQVDRNEMRQTVAQLRKENEALRAELFYKIDSKWIPTTEDAFIGTDTLTKEGISKKLNNIPITARRILVYFRYLVLTPCGSWNDIILSSSAMKAQIYLNYFPSTMGTNSQMVELEVDANDRYLTLRGSYPLSCPDNLKILVQVQAYKN